MSDDTDSMPAALGRLGTQITTLADQLGTLLDRSEDDPVETRAELVARLGRVPDSTARLRHDGAVPVGARGNGRRVLGSTRDELRAVNETMSLLGKRIRLLEADIRTLQGDPRCWTGCLLS
jgi:hypothetical protein